MKAAHWEKNILELIRRTATDLPGDVVSGLRRALQNEKKGSHAAWVIETALKNADIARRDGLPVCQDTGTLTFYFRVPVGYDTNALVSITCSAVAKATRHGYLRQNTVDSVTGQPYGTNIAHGSPVFHFEQGARKNVDIRLIMKGGGSENVGAQYSLPERGLDAARDMDGVRRCVLDAIFNAQGSGCAPGIVGVSLGGDRASGYEHAKEQFLRKLNDKSPSTVMAQLEKRIKAEAQTLGIGPMGMGGRTTVLGVKIGAMSRLPASFFVTISIMCWAFRRRGVLLGPEGGVERWLY
jgi:fumarate hydratase, class I